MSDESRDAAPMESLNRYFRLLAERREKEAPLPTFEEMWFEACREVSEAPEIKRQRDAMRAALELVLRDDAEGEVVLSVATARLVRAALR